MSQPLSGELWSSAGIDALYDRVTALETRHGCILRRAATQSITNNTPATITWDTEDEDTHGFIAVPATTVTIPSGSGGLYSVSFWVDFPNLAAATRVSCSLGFTGLGTGYPPDWVAISNLTEDEAWCSVSDIYLPDAATVMFNLIHNEGSAQNVTAWASMHRKQA